MQKELQRTRFCIHRLPAWNAIKSHLRIFQWVLISMLAASSSSSAPSYLMIFSRVTKNNISLLMISLLACFLLKGALKLSLLCSLIAPLSKVFTTKLVTKLLVKLKLTLFPDQFFPVLACLFIHLSSHLLPYDIKKRSRTFKIKAILACGTKKLKNQEPISSWLAKSGHQLF